MTDLYLIAHKVSSEPAFDVACRMTCPECKQEDSDIPDCPECDDLGYWWIIPTSGHRAYPYWQCEWNDLGMNDYIVPEMPPSLPDHYPTRSAPKVSLAEVLGLTKPKPLPLPPITRRI